MKHLKEKSITVSTTQTEKFLKDTTEAVLENRKHVYGAEEGKFVFNAIGNTLMDYGTTEAEVNALVTVLNRDVITAFKLFTKVASGLGVKVYKFKIILRRAATTSAILVCFETETVVNGLIQFYVSYNIAHTTTLIETMARVDSVYNSINNKPYTLIPEAQHIYDLVNKEFTNVAIKDFPVVAISDPERLLFFMPGIIEGVGLVVETAVIFAETHIAKPKPTLTVVK